MIDLLEGLSLEFTLANMARVLRHPDQLGDVAWLVVNNDEKNKKEGNYLP